VSGGRKKRYRKRMPIPVMHDAAFLKGGFMIFFHPIFMQI
jgi:hypothetical protein